MTLILGSETQSESVSDVQEIAAHAGSSFEELTFLSEPNRSDNASKTLLMLPNGALIKPDKGADYRGGARWSRRTDSGSNAHEFFAALSGAAHNEIFILGTPTPAGFELESRHGVMRRVASAQRDSIYGDGSRDPAMFEQIARRGFCIDIDSPTAAETTGLDVFTDARGAARSLADALLPPWVLGGPLAAQLSASSGSRGPSHVRVHFWIWLSVPITPKSFKAQLAAYQFESFGQRKVYDLSLYTAVQPHYIAPPKIRYKASPTQTAPDPIQRWHDLSGPLPATVIPASLKTRAADGTRGAGWTPSGNAGMPSELGTFRKAVDAIGDEKGGFHAPVRQAVWCLVVGALKRDPEASAESVLASIGDSLNHVRARALHADRGTRDASYVEGLVSFDALTKSALSAVEKARQLAISARSVVPAPRAEPLTPLADAERQVEAFIGGGWIGDSKDWLKAHEVARRLRSRNAPGIDHLRAGALYAPGVWVLAGGTALGKTTTALKALKTLPKFDSRQILASPTKELCEQALATAKRLGLERVSVIYGMDAITESGVKMCDMPDFLIPLAEQAQELGASKSEVVCAMCPRKENNTCAYWLGQAELYTPGLKLMAHAGLTTLDLEGPKKARDEGRILPLSAIATDEAVNLIREISMPVELHPGSVKDATDVQKAVAWLADVLRCIDRGAFNMQRGSQIHASVIRFLGHRQALIDAHNDCMTATSKSLRKELKKEAADVKLNGALFQQRAKLAFYCEIAAILQSQIAAGHDLLRGFKLETRDGRTVLTVSYLKPFLPMVPLLVMDATADPELVQLQFALWCDEYRGPESVTPFSYPLNFKRINAPSPHVKTVYIKHAPASKTKLDTPNAAAAAKAGKRLRSDAHFMQIAKGARFFTEGAKSAGLFGHKDQIDAMHKLGLIGANVIEGHHGRGTGLNRWESVDRFVIIGASRVHESELRNLGEQWGALYPRPMSFTSSEKTFPLAMRDGTGHGIKLVTPDDALLAALRHQIGEAQLEQEIGRVRGVRRTAANPAIVILMANAGTSQPIDAVIEWAELERLTVLDIAAQAGCVPTKAADMAALLPGVLDAGWAGRDEFSAAWGGSTAQYCMIEGGGTGCAKNGDSPYIEKSFSFSLGDNTVFGAVPKVAEITGTQPEGVAPSPPPPLTRVATIAGHLPDELLPPKLAGATVKLDRGNRKTSTHTVWLASKASADRLATALGRPLKAVEGLEGMEGIETDAAPETLHASAGHTPALPFLVAAGFQTQVPTTTPPPPSLARIAAALALAGP